MRAILKKFLPLTVRMQLKTAGYRLLDIVKPIKAPKVPPRAKTFIGGGDFAGVGDAFFNILKRYGLRPDMDVLDVGCGQGRMARPLAGWLTGSYHGFDIDKSGIVWCRTHYADMPNFNFVHADIINERYNPSGRIAAKDFRFPYEDNQFDMIYLTSVFTHMFKDDVENYMSEIARVLKPGGQCLISWFLYEDGLPHNPVYDFRYDVDDISRTTVAENPEAAIAFDMDWVKSLYAQHGLSLMDLQRGQWAGGKGVMGTQDLIVAKLAA